MMPTMTVSDQVRKLVEVCPASRHRLCSVAGVSAGNLSAFMSGRRGLSLEAVDKLGLVLGFTLAMDPAKGRKLAANAPPPGRPPIKRTRKSEARKGKTKKAQK
jgi:hypothetical protein